MKPKCPALRKDGTICGNILNKRFAQSGYCGLHQKRACISNLKEIGNLMPNHLNGVKFTLEEQGGGWFHGWFGDNWTMPCASEDDYPERNEIFWHIIEGNKRTLHVERMYIPETLRGTGASRALVEFQEQFAVQNDCTKIRLKPGSSRGGYFWTSIEYGWDEIHLETISELLYAVNLVSNGAPFELEDPRVPEGRFRVLEANLNELHSSVYDIVDDPIVDFADRLAINQTEDDEFFSVQEILDMGIDNYFKCDLTGERMWFGKAFLLGAGGWTAWKYL